MDIICIVEDNQVILEGITTYLELSGFAVKPFSTLGAARIFLLHTAPDLLILDVMLPDGDGFAFARSIRSSVQFPIIFLTARDSESDRIMGFELGADDYIVKPFSPKELVMRVRAILRRIDKTPLTGKAAESKWQSQGVTLAMDRGKHTLTIDSRSIELTAAEWRILEYMIDNSDIVVTREQILEHCLDYAFDVSDRIADTHIKNIRAKLGPSQWIKTIRGYGYSFQAEKIREQS